MKLSWQGRTHEQMRESFTWPNPRYLNMGVACSDMQPATSVALIDQRRDGTTLEVTFGQLSDLSSRFANGLQSLGVRPGDRVGVVAPQSLETSIAHLSIYKAGAVQVPLSALFGPERLRTRLEDCDPRVVVTARGSLERVVEACEGLETNSCCRWRSSRTAPLLRQCGGHGQRDTPARFRHSRYTGSVDLHVRDDRTAQRSPARAWGASGAPPRIRPHIQLVRRHP